VKHESCYRDVPTRRVGPLTLVRSRVTTHYRAALSLLALMGTLGVVAPATLHCDVTAVAPATPGTWSKDFDLRESMRIYDFPEELVNYSVDFPPGTVRRDSLSLVRMDGDRSDAVPFQLSDVVERDGFLTGATIFFRTDLPKGATRRFRLAHQTEGRTPVADTSVGIMERDGATVVVGANQLMVKVPFGSQTYDTAESRLLLEEVLAPILAVARPASSVDWIGRGAFRCETQLKVETVKGELIEDGPLFGRYRVVYTVAGGRRYTVVLTLQQDEHYVKVDEYLEGFRPEDEAYLHLDLVPGLYPTKRQVMSNGGYDSPHRTVGFSFTGEYEKKVGADGRLPFELGLYTPNSLGVMRACAFWSEARADALLLSVYRSRDWKTAKRLVWRALGEPGNFWFFQRGTEKYLETRLEGRERHWAIGVVPREQLMVPVQIPGRQRRGRPPVVGAEVRLWQKLSGFSLNRVKNLTFDWSETSSTHLAKLGIASKLSYSDWIARYGVPDNRLLTGVVNYFWDVSAETGPVAFRQVPLWYGDYDASRPEWTEDERRHVRSILVWMANSCEGDENVPHHSMLGGHPNFISDVKQTLPIACAVFPNHPDARGWRESFMEYFEEWLDVYQREPDPEHNAVGGRWTENIACYSGQSLAGLLLSAEAMSVYDGTDLLDHPRVGAWLKWYLLSMMSPHDGVRLVPPEGAHADAFHPDKPERRDLARRDILFELSRRISKSAPELSSHLRWVLTSGKEGQCPDLRSVLIRDHGPVLRYDFGGRHESYLHFMQIGGPLNYRWGAGSGTLYYGARNKIWSYNLREDNGDNFNVNRITAFSVAGKGLGRNSTDQPLYDFDFAQFYRAVAQAETAQETGYRSRVMMLLRDDYAVIYDDVEGNVEGQFAWVNIYEMPQVYQLKPGATREEQVRHDDSRPEQRKQFGLGKPVTIWRYRGQGDFLTVVAPEPVAATAMPFGALVSGEYVFVSDEQREYRGETAAFKGKVGYARPRQLALFEGELLQLEGFEIRRVGGDFGVSAVLRNGTINGRIAGRQGGRIIVRPPVAVKQGNVRCWIDDENVPVRVEDGAVVFDVSISQRDGYKSYRIDLNPF